MSDDDKAKWLNACADQFQRKARDADRATAMALAEAAYFSTLAAYGHPGDPKEAADIEMSYWED